ncbi:hypothetical protein QYF36_007917 [Acer negundo]|nr:hypothetical protein QYF36_007917 [Acer negundo]
MPQWRWYVRIFENLTIRKEFCLLSKVITNKQINRKAFRTFIPRIWRLKHEMEIEVIRDNLFAFYFKNRMKKRRVLTLGPWSLDKSLVVLEDSTKEGEVDSMALDKAEF